MAPLLLGGILRCRGADGTVSLRLTEVEAYSGEGEDPGSHAHRGPSKRNAVMFGPPGHLYTYFTYGMHVCANVVCLPEGRAAGILFRAGEILEGEELARSRRTTSRARKDLAQGPARLCVALGIELGDYGLDLFDPASRVTLQLPEAPLGAEQVGVGPRTGIAQPGGAETPWRFWVLGDPTVSPYKAAAPRPPRG
ncbi:putative 3-methyladenine DNA glycosylase [Naasia aerilata]|uniref:Putative 3-methyladenine DNA glycosylase n=1 Tax=Naasia aerilata TaxID=1162966 RepID=A0ABN6XRB8_9MICO|nr:putative 3-methyladenine DNA glycosylase [Naasia aerilata]